jgi:hypothetical protein
VGVGGGNNLFCKYFSPPPPPPLAFLSICTHFSSPTFSIRRYVYTQLSNVHSHPTDCPTREKRGWTGDSQLTSAGAALNFDAAGMYGNWLMAMRDHQGVGCAPAGTPPVFPQADVDVCCDPPDDGFGCDYTGVPGGALWHPPTHPHTTAVHGKCDDI